MANGAIVVANTNFADIKENIKTYLKDQDILADYNFDGSNMSVLLDILAYNTFMNNFYLNQVASESFLDSAQLRDSIVSHAKALNYTPRSETSAKATVNIEIFPANTPASIIMSKYTTFTTSVEQNTYSFTTNEGLTIVADNKGRYLANNVDIFEGEIVKEVFQVSTANTDQRFVLSNEEIDTDSLAVKIATSSTDTSNSEWSSSLSSIGLSGTSNVYFVVPAEGNKYELQFGDGVIGRKLNNGNIVEVAYRKCNANAANEASVFSISDISGFSNVVVTTVSNATGGGPRETEKSIKFSAPKALTIQDRTVTVSDYKTILQQQFNDIEAINVFGGEESDPPEFGKVIISIDLKNATGIPNSKKKEIEDYVKVRAPLGIAPKVIDPTFLFVDVTSKVRYNPNLTTKSDSEISTLVSTAINDFAAANINDFNSKLRVSKLVTSIDAADTSILNNETTVLLQKKFTPSLNTKESFTLQFNNEVYREIPESSSSLFVDGTSPLSSTPFTFGELTGCTLRDNGSGSIEIVQLDASQVTIVKSKVGTIDYDTGKVSLPDFEVSAFTGDSITVSVNPVAKTLSSSKNIILSYNETPSISIEQERI